MKRDDLIDALERIYPGFFDRTLPDLDGTKLLKYAVNVAAFAFVYQNKNSSKDEDMLRSYIQNRHQQGFFQFDK